MHDAAPAYGLWPLVILNSAVFIIFAFTYLPKRTTGIEPRRGMCSSGSSRLPRTS